MKINKKISLSIGSLFMLGAMATVSVSCFSVTKSDEASVAKANEEQMAITRAARESNSTIWFDASAITNKSHFSDAIANKILEVTGITKNTDSKFGYRVFPEDITVPTANAGGHFMADIRAYYNGTVNEATQGIGGSNRVKVHYDLTEVKATQNDVRVAAANIKGAAVDNQELFSTLRYSELDFNQGVASTTPKAFNAEVLKHFGLSVTETGPTANPSNKFPNLNNINKLMGTTLTYIYDRAATPKPSFQVIVKKGTANVVEVINYGITFKP